MAINLLPLLLIGGAAAYVVSSKKKKSKVKVIDKGTYKYSADCRHFWVAGIDFSTADSDIKPNLTKKQEAELQAFLTEALMPALEDEANSHEGDTSWDDQPLVIFEWAIGAVARLTPECKVVRGEKISNVALIGMTLAATQMPPLIQQEGGNVEEFFIHLAADAIILSKEMARVGSKSLDEGKVDILAFIDHVRKNPKQYQLAEEEIKEFLSGKGLADFDLMNMA